MANPGCYPTGAIGLIRPLVDAGLIPADYPITINAVSGYSGGGKAMIQAHEAAHGPGLRTLRPGPGAQARGGNRTYGGLTRRPIFVPSVGHILKGMLVSVPLHLDTLPGKPTGADLRAALEARYAGCDLVRVVPAPADGKLEPEALNDTDRLELIVHANEKYRQAVLVARLDNLGKGASGAAVQNIALMLGLHTGVGRAGVGGCLNGRYGTVFSLDGVTPTDRRRRVHRAHRRGHRRRRDRIGDRRSGSTAWSAATWASSASARAPTSRTATVIHINSGGMDTFIGDDVTVGHNAVIHACTLKNRAFVGISATVLDGAVIEEGGLLGAGGLLTPGKVIGPNEMWTGSPPNCGG